VDATSEARSASSKCKASRSSLLINATCSRLAGYAKGVHGSDVILEFEERTKAENFIRDNLEGIKDFEVPGKGTSKKKGFFQLYLDPEQWKTYHATRLLAKKMGAAESFKDLAVRASKYKGTISVSDFEVIKIKMKDDKSMQYIPLKNNIEDTDIEGLLGKIQTIISEFMPTFE